MAQEHQQDDATLDPVAALDGQIDALRVQMDKLQEDRRKALRAERNRVMQDMRELMAKYEIAPEDLAKLPSHGKGVKIPAKYKNPATGETWSGRGKAPAWIAGQDREAFRIGAAG